ncbi:hypothetical protein [Hyalangium gracile]|uniref:hypothetical protein n=1 Tax=Hyalangium gracile TaxID=394092 RepID=UPI001CCEF599|nr:hypothetical protein [Hyalangium gracile]
MVTYNDLFFRTNLSDAGQLPSLPPAYTSPDIIPSGMNPISEPDRYFVGNYGQDVGQDIINQANNYIYLRARNFASGPQSGLMSLYYTKASLLLYPSQWQSNQLKTSDGRTQVAVTNVSPNAIAVATDPFVWNPPALGSGDHFCLISQVVTNEHPNPIPPTGSVNDLTQFIIENPGFGWRNVSLTDAGAPTFTTPVGYQQGSDGGQMLFLLECKNVPAGASVAFSSGTPGPDPLIDLQKTTVPANNGSWATGIISTVPANFETTISYSYWANGTTPAPGWSITLTVQNFVPSNHSLYNRLLTPHQLGVPRSLVKTIGARKGLAIGSHTTRGV